VHAQCRDPRDRKWLDRHMPTHRRCAGCLFHHAAVQARPGDRAITPRRTCVAEPCTTRTDEHAAVIWCGVVRPRTAACYIAGMTKTIRVA
jgi:hypothetical protein